MSFCEKYILKVHYFFFQKINNNNLEFYNNKLFLINNNGNYVKFFMLTENQMRTDFFVHCDQWFTVYNPFFLYTTAIKIHLLL